VSTTSAAKHASMVRVRTMDPPIPVLRFEVDAKVPRRAKPRQSAPKRDSPSLRRLSSRNRRFE
jgi:hypothetical protein